MPRDPAAILEVLPLIGGRLSVAIDEIIRLLKDDLPGVIAAFNAANPGTKIEKPKNIRIAPSDLESVDIDEILIDFSSAAKPQGTNNFTSFTTISIYSIDERIIQGRHVQNVSDRADLIRAVLYDGLADWANPNGLRVWSALTWQSKSQLPGEWSKYSGATLTCLLVQSMNDGWA